MSATFGAVQLASGSNLSGSSATIAAEAQSNLVNRAVKADRVATVSSAAGTRTISLKLSGLEDTSVLVRIPARIEPKAASSARPAQTRRASNFGCDPVVSVLTEVAKTLAPGRCIS